VLDEEPLCRTCLAQGEESLSEDVDHIVPLEDGGPQWERANLQGLCAYHHAEKTAGEHSRRAHRGVGEGREHLQALQTTAPLPSFKRNPGTTRHKLESSSP
jgi:5-methylcytosine-specific restriction endonuclease McrA